MHALIAKGAENITGPWLCLECGVDGRPISISSYRSFRSHLINIHKQNIDPCICEHCGHRSNKRNDLHDHNQHLEDTSLVACNEKEMNEWFENIIEENLED